MADPHVPPPVPVEPEAEAPGACPGKRLPPAAVRALEEAAARRAAIDAAARAASETPEDGGPKGLEPTRFGDWERKGVAVDF
jgi:hypothetical protein